MAKMTHYLCLPVMVARVIRQGRLVSTTEQLATAQLTLRRERGRCLFCRKCRIGFYLAQACFRKDPYAIVELFQLAKEDGIVLNDAPTARSVDEALAWVGGEARVAAAAQGTVAELIRRWRNHEPVNEEELKQAFKDSRLVWPVLLMKASLVDAEGDVMRARQAYDIAYRATPGWLPESASIRDRLNSLTNALPL